MGGIKRFECCFFFVILLWKHQLILRKLLLSEQLGAKCLFPSIVSLSQLESVNPLKSTYITIYTKTDHYLMYTAMLEVKQQWSNYDNSERPSSFDLNCLYIGVRGLLSHKKQFQSELDVLLWSCDFAAPETTSSGDQRRDRFQEHFGVWRSCLDIKDPIALTSWICGSGTHSGNPRTDTENTFCWSFANRFFIVKI